MKKKAYVTGILVFVLSTFFISSLSAFDSLIIPTSEKDALYEEAMQSFYDELVNSLYINPEDPEDNIGPKHEEIELDRRGHRIRIPTSEHTDKKFIETEN
ncbi:MAG: hypothetical protein JW794_00800 [Candidatus Cloacimonetes bacterium]|nr:hypothetical protein [Candidatus Cloacimonadota bacterium]